jgi:hypothetical protein
MLQLAPPRNMQNKTKAMTKFLASIMRFVYHSFDKQCYVKYVTLRNIFYIALFICQHSSKITNVTVRLEAIKESKAVIEVLRAERQDESV